MTVIEITKGFLPFPTATGLPRHAGGSHGRTGRLQGEVPRDRRLAARHARGVEECGQAEEDFGRGGGRGRGDGSGFRHGRNDCVSGRGASRCLRDVLVADGA